MRSEAHARVQHFWIEVEEKDTVGVLEDLASQTDARVEVKALSSGRVYGYLDI